MAKRLLAEQLDLKAKRLEELDAERETIMGELKAQVEEFGWTPPRAEKSKRLAGNVYQFTLSTSSTTELKDAEIRRLEETCDKEVFALLYRKETAYKLAKGAMEFLAKTLPENAPRNLRQLFAQTFTVHERKPSLRVEQLKAEFEVKNA